MTVIRRLALTAAAALLAATTTPTANGHGRGYGPPPVTELATFGTLGQGSTVGPDRALYVTDAPNGQVLRIDRHTGAVSTFAHGLPPNVAPIGGAIDVAFRGGTAYVLVTLVGPAFGQPDVVNGLYKVKRDGSVKPVADIGAWATANPPAAGGEVPSGVQFAMERYGKGFLVTDGNHNRLLWVGKHGRIKEVATFGNIAPTGLERKGRLVLMGQAGPMPHLPEDGKILAGWRAGTDPVEVASGAPLLVDVELGPKKRLFGLSQGIWDLPVVPENAGAPASPDTGALMKVTRHGGFRTVVDGLDRPTSLEFVGHTAYVVTLTGSVLRIG